MEVDAPEGQGVADRAEASGAPEGVGAIRLLVEVDDDDPDCAALYVDGSIDSRPYRFLLDTGAARSQVVADSFLSAFATHGSHESRGAFGRSHKSAVIEVPELRVGPLKMTSLLVTMTPTDEPGAQNLIGMDVLGSQCCCFLFSTAELRLGKSEAHPNWIPLRQDAAAHPYVEMSWRDVRGHAVWDTGAGITVVDERFYRRWPELFTAHGSSVGTDATGAQVAAETAMMGPVSIGGKVFEAHKVAVVDLSQVNATIDLPMDLILGYTTLNQADWTFDFPRRRWCFSRATTRQS